MKTFVVMRETDVLKDEQVRLLDEKFGSWELLNPGWTEEEMDEALQSVQGVLVFASPIMSMLKRAAYLCFIPHVFSTSDIEAIYVFTYRDGWRIV